MDGSAAWLRPDIIISGGQTGADIGGLVGARRAGIKTGGSAPKGYRTEKGPQVEVLKSFGLIEYASSGYGPRTRKNVTDADITIIIAAKPKSGGTVMTMEICDKEKRPYLLVGQDIDQWIDEARKFVLLHKPIVMNVAGNRESKAPGIARATARLIQMLFP